MNEQQLWKAASEGRLTRRDVLRSGIVLGLSIPTIAALTAACGTSQNTAAPGGSATAAPPASSGSPAQALEFMGWDFQPDKIKEFLATWTALSGVPVNATIVPNVGYPAAIQTKLQAGGEIDVFYNNTFNSGKFLSAGWARNLEDLPDVSAMLDDMYPNLRGRYATSDGTVLSVPYWTGSYAFIYNSSNLAKAGITTPPQTLTELYDQCVKLKSTGVSKYPYTAYWIKTFMEEYLMCYLLAEGITPFDDAGNPVFADDPKTVGVFEWWQSMYQDELVPSTLLTDSPDPSVAKMGSGESTFFPFHDYFLRIVRSAENAPEAKNVSIYYRMPGASGKTYMAGDVIQMGNKMDSPSVSAAWDLMKFYGWKDSTGKFVTFNAWAEAAALGAPYPAFWKDPAVRASFGDYYDFDELNRVYESGSDIVPARSLDWYGTFQVACGDRLQALVTGQLSPSDAVKALAQDAKDAAAL